MVCITNVGFVCGSSINEKIIISKCIWSFRQWHTHGKFHSGELSSCVKQHVNHTRFWFYSLLMYITFYENTPPCSLTNRTNKLSPMVAKSFVWRSEAFFNPCNASVPASSLCGTFCVGEANDADCKGWAWTCCLDKQESLRIHIHYFVGKI